MIVSSAGSAATYAPPSLLCRLAVTHLPGSNYNNYAWQHDSAMPPAPSDAMCDVFGAWRALLAAAERAVAVAGALDGDGDALGEPFRYDLVNTGREVLAQLALPLSLDFNAR